MVFGGNREFIIFVFGVGPEIFGLPPMLEVHLREMPH